MASHTNPLELVNSERKKKKKNKENMLPLHRTRSDDASAVSNGTSTRSKLDVGKFSSKQLPFPMENKRRRKLRLIFTRKTTERKLFMDELKIIRKDTENKVLKNIKKSVGPSWYQVLSTRQRAALDRLEFNMKHDIISGRADGVMVILNVLNICPIPHVIDVFSSMDASKGNPMEFFAILFYTLYDHEISVKRYHYDLNQRIILSSIFYLGLPDLKRLLQSKFAWNGEKSSPPPPDKKRKQRHKSPYLWPMKAPMWFPAPPQKKKPDPLPDLGWLNAPMQQEPSIPRPTPSPPPPPPRKDTLDIDYCMQLAGYYPILGPPPKEKPIEITQPISRRRRPTKMIFKAEKKVYGLDRSICPSFKLRAKKPRYPIPTLENEQYNILGMSVVKRRAIAIVGGMIKIPIKGFIIHGGYVMFKGEFIVLNLGIKGEIPNNYLPPCTCVEALERPVFRYLNKHKCTCHHRFDFKNEGDFSREDDEEPYFQRPSSRNPHLFRTDNIYQTDQALGALYKTIHSIWDEDSLLNIPLNSIDSYDVVALAREELKRIKKENKYRKHRLPDCLGTNPKVEDYLRCSIRQFRLINIAARLPNVHMTRELKEWMRMRIFGPLTAKEKKKLNNKSTAYWAYLKYFEKEGLGVARLKLPDYLKKNIPTDYNQNKKLYERFKRFTHHFRVKIYKKHSAAGNLFWATMCHPEFPDKHFRDIYFSYMINQVNDVLLNHPHSIVETMEKVLRKQQKRTVCLAKGAADVDLGWFKQ
ncbi:hypothetical protein O0L34_g8253 [Tuta absoluta]|nr:hypothetical protein O0L34_g8253 [Tuta absoluta]